MVSSTLLWNKNKVGFFFSKVFKVAGLAKACLLEIKIFWERPCCGWWRCLWWVSLCWVASPAHQAEEFCPIWWCFSNIHPLKNLCWLEERCCELGLLLVRGYQSTWLLRFTGMFVTVGVMAQEDSAGHGECGVEQLSTGSAGGLSQQQCKEECVGNGVGEEGYGKVWCLAWLWLKINSQDRAGYLRVHQEQRRTEAGWEARQKRVFPGWTHITRSCGGPCYLQLERVVLGDRLLAKK